MRRTKKLNQIISVLTERFKPSRMFLFGSQASGTATADSDYDFVLVVPNLTNRIDLQSEARSLVLNSCGALADVFIYDQATFDQWKGELSSIPETALNTGKEIELG